jgi:GalNAc-alpha-(1->4)-GalNAc-alpha-(1->3)-diNAcBac-PP-undecaprenol alpha-1,4-N-acetyl-D-galactosaminyltransferase
MNVYVLLACVGLPVPVIISERIDPRFWKLGAAFDMIRRLIYSRAAALVVQTKSVIPWAEKHIGRGKIWVIPNPVRPLAVSSGVDSGPRKPQIVAMGRMVEQKGFDLLLGAFARCVRNGLAGWNLLILGDGPDGGNLEKVADTMGIRELVSMPGRVRNPEKILSESSIFVLSSRFEGFPNALLEAMSCSMAVISFDCPSGPKDIIQHGENGILVPLPDEEKLSAAIDELARDEALRTRLGTRAAEVADRYSLPFVMNQWETLLKKVAVESRS